MINVYGLKNCNTCRKALSWLAAEGIDHTFRDVRKDGIRDTDVRHWLETAGHETVINRRSTTWRQLDHAEKEATDTRALIALVMTHPAIIKRPLFVTGDTVVAGFRDEQKSALKAITENGHREHTP